MLKNNKMGLAIWAAVSIMTGFVSASYALPNGVSKTVHNLGYNSPAASIKSTQPTETEVCIYCHTPHNAVAGQMFLWNRPNTAGYTWAMYTSSPTLNFTTNPSAPSDVSKMCMTCHDGVTAMNSMANPSTAYAEPTITLDMYVGGPNIGGGDTASPGTGGNLLNDHPISFSYTESRAGDPTIKDISVPQGQGLLFWGPGQNMVECVTCHDPHVNYGYPQGYQSGYDPAMGGDASLKPFLRRSNASSNLCFACHDK